MQRLKARLIESLTAKLEFWNHIPWIFCGIWDLSWKTAAVNGVPLQLTEDRHKKLSQACIEYDRLIAANLKSDIPRTAHRLFGPGIIRSAMDGAICQVRCTDLVRSCKYWASTVNQISCDVDALTNP